MIYTELDSVERPIEKIINNDKRLDEYMERLMAKRKKQAMEYHKNDKEANMDPMDKPTLVYGK